jgi:hypothetical protein
LGFAINPAILARAGHLIQVAMPKPGEPGGVPAVENILLARSGDTVHYQLLWKAGNRAITVYLCAIFTQDSQHFLVVYQNACVPKNAKAGTMDAFDVVV